MPGGRLRPPYRDRPQPSGARSACLIAHTQHYHDELLCDFGANPLRKTGVLAPLKELIAPYEPRDYASLFAETNSGDS